MTEDNKVDHLYLLKVTEVPILKLKKRNEKLYHFVNWLLNLSASCLFEKQFQLMIHEAL